jgi:serine/threonine protein kinase/tetratricopeptide (TPR) repeat protein
MNPTHWARMKEWFEAAMEHPPADRESWLKRVCADEPELYSELNRLISHAEQMGEFLDGVRPEEPPHIFSAGQCIANRFEILEFLGKGGMGEVYSATDTVLGTSVALKTLRAEMASDVRNVERLRREIQLARQVTHRSVCRVFDLEQHAGLHGEILFLTMELISGETLAQHIARRGRLTEEETQPIASQIAQALDAAHRVRIVHRDLKPANVMLSPEVEGISEFRAVVMDFGLARNSDPTSVGTRQLFGTPLYMAPELLEGKDASTASDIYALGVTLHEMLTGAKPAKGSRANGDLPRRWRPAIERALDPLPQRRPASALELLELAGAGSPVRFRFLALPRRSQLAAVVVLLAMAVFAAAFRLYEQQPHFPPGSMLLLTDVVNATGDRQLDATTEVFRSQLGQSAQIRLWDRARLAQLLRTMNLPDSTRLTGKMARDVAWREGVPFILFGSVAPLGDGLSLNLRLEQLAPASVFARSAWESSVRSADKEHLLDGIHESSVWLRHRLGEKSGDLAVHDRPPQETTTSSWEALANFARAEDFQRQYQTDTAIAVLRQAVQLDPHFALAYTRLGDLLTSTYRYEEGLKYYRIAQDETNREHLTRREQLNILGIYSIDTDNLAAAEAAFAQLEQEYPRDYLPSFYLAHTLRWQKRLEESLRKLRDADRKRKDSLSVVSGLAVNYLLMGRNAELNQQIDRLQHLGYVAFASHYRGLGAFAAADYTKTLASFHDEMASPDPGSHHAGAYLYTAVLCELGRWDEAKRQLDEELRADATGAEPELRSNELLAAAYVAWMTGNTTQVGDFCREAISPQVGPAMVSRVGVLLARAGRSSEAKALETRLRAMPVTPLATAALTRLSAENLLAEGKAPQAVAGFERLDSLEPALRHREGLARAWLRAGQPEKALTYCQPLLDGRYLWQTVERDYPGILTDAAGDCAQAAAAAGRVDIEREARLVYSNRRPVPTDVSLSLKRLN